MSKIQSQGCCLKRHVFQTYAEWPKYHKGSTALNHFPRKVTTGSTSQNMIIDNDISVLPNLEKITFQNFTLYDSDISFLLWKGFKHSK